MSTKAAKQSSAGRTTGKRDLVFGLGATGLSIARYLERNDVNAIYVDTRAEPPGIAALENLCPDARVVLGDTPKRLLKGVSRIVVSPGIPDSDDFLVAARNKGIEVVSDIELFTAEAAAPIVAVTGSNGKSTVTTLIALMCDAAGKTGLAGANLGVPALDLLLEEPPDFYVLELSSFQLRRTKHLPARVAVLLNISTDHLDWHGSEDEYRSAKYRIFAEAESAVFNREDEEARRRIGDDMPSLGFGLDEPGEDEYGLRIDQDECFLARGEQLLINVSDLALVGRHNQANGLAAMAAGQLMGLPIRAMLQVLHEFPGLPHRMQLVSEARGVRYINDSKATNVGAAIASIEAIEGAVVLIAGGQGKGGDFERLATSTSGRLRAAVLIGEDAPRLADAFEGLAPVEFAKNMSNAVIRAAALAENGDTVLLAPACASFDQYPDYKARGEDFTQAVEALAT